MSTQEILNWFSLNADVVRIFAVGLAVGICLGCMIGGTRRHA